mgnify:CR=1 FL=1
MFDRTGTIEFDNRVFANRAEIGTGLCVDTREKRGQAIIVGLTVNLERMVMAASTLQPYPQKNLGRGFGQIRSRRDTRVVVP